jgi:hypothetical protein
VTCLFKPFREADLLAAGKLGLGAAPADTG